MNPREKGKRGERKAASLLRKHGFDSARRTQQYRGSTDSPDIEAKELDRLHIEVKFGYPLARFDLGLKLWNRAIQKARREADGKPFVVLWKPKGARQWRCTYWDGVRPVTVVGAETIRELLKWLNDCAKGDEGPEVSDA